MRDGARAQAAIEVLEDSQNHKRLPAMSLKDWALKHRFAGSKDRSAIGDIVFMALRLRASSVYKMSYDAPRAWVLGALVWGFGLEVQKLIDDAQAEVHAFSPPTELEISALSTATTKDAPPWVKGDYPEWLDSSLATIFGESRVAQLAAIAKPAPLDLRVNIANASVEKVLADLLTSPKLTVTPSKTKLSAWGIRIPWSVGKNFPFAVEPSFLRGEFEVQDEASQVCALLTGAKAGQKIADICAGGGGKTLALAAMSNDKATIIAYDVDPNRIAPIHDRLRRAGVNCVDVRTERKGASALADLAGKMDIVLVDAPCTGSGTWRRAPDTKWRLTPQNLEKRQGDQQAALRIGAPLVKVGGTLCYVTCSILPQENDDSIEWFLAENNGFVVKDISKHLKQLDLEYLLEHVILTKYGIQFTPLTSDTDGFYVAILERKSGS
ncbi:MAG: 16S rRNA (cytosine967-C5)-methyltransferase [Hyphomonadaceae bacterium]|nr:MAG: 16S rRNA (cytosine967-C5)-methyltransferase [Hyphomonadaceae bacterium]KAF0186360.1 MAG: 16S rRNA (cytosine967-C5)-methyltransferase [Hyphomonadaceae bacterium]